MWWRGEGEWPVVSSGGGSPPKVRVGGGVFGGLGGRCKSLWGLRLGRDLAVWGPRIGRILQICGKRGTGWLWVIL